LCEQFFENFYTFLIKVIYLFDEVLNLETPRSRTWVPARGEKRAFASWKLGLRSQKFLKTRNQKFNSD